VTLAADTRKAVRRNPFLFDALRAGVVNYSAAARFLDVPGETETIVAALRRYATDLADDAPPERGATVSMQSDLGDGEPADALLVVGDAALVPDAGSLTALIASVEAARALERTLGRLRTADLTVEAAAVGGGSLVVVVGRRDGPHALRAVEDAVGG
jgi:hypothetical protein